MWTPPIRQRLRDGRHHFSHGPIDLVIDVTGEPEACAQGIAAAWIRFETILPELAGELTLLRSRYEGSMAFEGAVARRMTRAVAPYAADVFVTPMAAVAGAVADEIRATIDGAGEFDRVHVNNGGDIAVSLRGEARIRVGLVQDTEAPDVHDTVDLGAGDGIGGIATSGRHGRSFSLGVADAVTVLAADAAGADAAATLIANAVDIDSPNVRRRPARDLDPDSDLGALPVTVDVAPLDAEEASKALDAGAARAQDYLRRGLIRGAAFYLQSHKRVVGAATLLEEQV